LAEWLKQQQTEFTEYDDTITRKYVEKVTVLNAETIRIKFRYVEELPSEEEYQATRASLDRAGWEVDYIITHCCSTSVQNELSGGFY